MTRHLLAPASSGHAHILLTLLLIGLVIGCSDPGTMPLARPDVARGILAVPEEWTYEVLGNPGDPNEPAFSVEAINDSDHVTGVGRFNPVVAWRWRSGVFHITPPTPGSWAGGYGINSHGDVFGIRSTDQLAWFGMAWHFEGGGSSMVSFPPLTPGARVDGADINDHGYAIGSECARQGRNGACQTRALLWRPTQRTYPWKPSVLGLGPVGNLDRAVGINNDGTSLGHTTSGIGGSTRRAWLALVNGTMELLPIGNAYSESWPGDINDHNMSVGVAHRKRDGRHRFVYWLWASLPFDLGIPMDAEFPNWRAPIRVSNKTRIAFDVDDQPYTFRSGVLTTLPLPDSAIATVAGVNTCGRIVGTLSYLGNGGRFLIRWTRRVHGVPVCD